MMVSQNSLVSGNRHPNCPSHREAEIQAENVKEWIPACLRLPTPHPSPWPHPRGLQFAFTTTITTITVLSIVTLPQLPPLRRMISPGLYILFSPGVNALLQHFPHPPFAAVLRANIFETFTHYTSQSRVNLCPMFDKHSQRLHPLIPEHPSVHLLHQTVTWLKFAPLSRRSRKVSTLGGKQRQGSSSRGS